MYGCICTTLMHMVLCLTYIYSKESLEEFPCVYPHSSVLVQKISSLDPATPM